MNALNQVPGRSQPPRELRKNLVLLVGPREIRVGTWLTVVVTEILVSREEPQSIPNDWSADVRGGIPVTGALVPAHPVACARNDQPHRLAAQSRRLPVVRRVIQQTIAALPGDDVDDGTLDIAELR